MVTAAVIIGLAVAAAVIADRAAQRSREWIVVACIAVLFGLVGYVQGSL